MTEQMAEMDDLPEGSGEEMPEDDNWLTMARDAFEQSTDWFDASLRPTIEKSLAHFANRHAPGSKYHADSYKYRAKSFRPKTRGSIRRNEAAAATAFFSTQDVVYVSPENDGDQEQRVSADILTELVNYRLDDSIPWFITCIGAYQEALNVGVAISHQHWELVEEVEKFQLVDESGDPVLDEAGQPVTRDEVAALSDKPRIDLIPIENFRISPASNWSDPIGTSPYLIHMEPMHVGDVKERMVSGEWIEYSDGEIQKAAESQYDSIRAARDGKRRADKLDVSHATTDFDTVWVHRNIIRKDGEDWFFYSLGNELLLTEPVPLLEVYIHLRRGERPYAMGSCIIEAHKNYPAGLNELTSGLQEDANDINNQRRDNVNLILNKRYFARRTANIDYKSLTRNVPGSVTLVDDINGDIRWDSPGEVTGSSYQEQDRISLDYDELAGTFSPGSVQSNRQLNETVGGMNMLTNDANVMTEYQLRVFASTWVEPVLKQLVRMEQAYESDAKILAIAGSRAKLMQRFGISEVNDALLKGMVTVRVNVGFGSTNPQKRIEKLSMGLATIGKFLPQLMQSIDGKEVVTEVFGALGYKGAERFFPGMGDGEQQDPQIQQMQQAIQQLQQVIQGKQVEQQGKMELRQMELAAESQENDKDRMLEQWLKQIDSSIDTAKLNAEQRMAFDELRSVLTRDAAKLRTQRDLAMAPRPAPQVARPPTEPPGRAPNGFAYQR